MRARLGVPSRWQRSTRPPLRTRRAWTGPNEGAVSVTKAAGWPETLSGMPFPPARPARMSW